MTKCRVKSAFGSYRVGDIIEPTALYRDRLVALGYVDVVPDEAKTVEEPEEEKPKRGRPRKVVA